MLKITKKILVITIFDVTLHNLFITDGEILHDIYTCLVNFWDFVLKLQDFIEILIPKLLLNFIVFEQI